MRLLRMSVVGFALGILGLMAVAWVSLIPLDPGSLSSRHDKLAHLSVYSVVGAWFGIFVRLRWWPLLWLALGLFGVGIELAQQRTGYRSFDRWDILTNWTGISLGLALLAAPLRYWLVPEGRADSVLR